jgi:iron complex transport system ATP-binding protein
MKLVEAKSLNYSFNKNKSVLNDINLSINKGETWAIVGKNGSGKSSLIKCMCGFYKVPKDSFVSIKEKKINEYSPRELAKILSYVPQAGNRLSPPFSVFQYVLMGRFPYISFLSKPTENDFKIVNEALELTDTSHLSDRRMATLSGGELQRVFIAGAVAQRTEIVFLDEPISFLDPLHQEMVYKSLSRIHDEFGTTLLTVTHDINSAIQKNSHIAALVDGRIVFAGETKTFFGNCPSILEKIYNFTFCKYSNSELQKVHLVPCEDSLQ